MIYLDSIAKEFYDGDEVIEVLKSTTLKIGQGEFNAIIGPSGSGKSTLLTIIGALQKPSQGELYINSKAVSVLTEAQAADLRLTSIGFILQGSNLVPFLTVYEQFELKIKQGSEKVTHEMIDKLLSLLGIMNLKKKYPDEISGGERQRVAIGLALALQPKIILADEPTASLDTEKAIQVVDILGQVSKEFNTTVIMVTHDERMVENCDRIFEMKDGVLKETKTII